MSNILARTYEAAFVPTQSDTVDDPNGCFAAIMVNAPGNVKVRMCNGQDVVLTLLGGTLYPFAVKRVWSTGTTAAGITCFSSTPYKPSTPSQK